ncbi:MAG: TIGR03936 family radical SAM-associated protein, partial [Oscillospiraceae bacterium]
DRAKYISHLDITRCMQRALTRAKLPIWYTEGFNPHIYITFALPLSLGYESKSEIMDMRLTEEMQLSDVKNILNNALPSGINVTKVALPKNKPEIIKTANYTINLKSNDISPQTLIDCVNNMLSEEKIEVSKHTKKGNKIVDIKPDIKINSIEIDSQNDSVNINIDTCAGIDKNINPTLFTDELIGKYMLTNVITSVMRNGIYDENQISFE